MFSDHLITIAGKSITITSHDMLMMFVSVVTGLLFWTALYFSRKRIVVLKRSSGTDQVTFELSRIADALERIRPNMEYATPKTGVSPVLWEQHGRCLRTGHAVSGVQEA